MAKPAMSYSAEYVRQHIQERVIEEDRGHSSRCWIWQSGINRSGYATGRPAGCAHGGMHRHSYQAFVGPIPDGLVIDHLCRVKACVNPDHLEPVTQSVNLLRNPPRYHEGQCRRGHEFVGHNVMVWRGQRRCRKCLAIWRAEKAATRKDEGRVGCVGQRPTLKGDVRTHHGLGL